MSRRGTTPTHRFEVDKEINDIIYARIIYRQMNGTKVQVDNDRVTVTYANGKTVFQCTLTQKETLSFRPAPCDVFVQIRCMLQGGSVIASDIIKIQFKDILDESIIELE